MNLFFEKVKFTRTYNFTVLNFNDNVSEEIINKLTEVLLHNNNVPDKKFMYFLSILRGTSYYKEILGKQHKKQVKSRMKELVNKEPIGKKVHVTVFAPDAD